MPSTTYPFTNSANYTKNNTDVTGGKGQLALTDKPSQNFTEPFDNDTGFTYDNTKAEFSAGKVQQKIAYPSTGLVLFSNYEDSTFDAEFSVATPAGGSGGTIPAAIVTFAGSKQVFLNTSNGVSTGWTDTANDPGDIGSMIYEMTTVYAGFPTGNDRDWISIGDTINPGQHYLVVRHKVGSGDVELLGRNSTGTFSVTAISGYSALASTKVQLYLGWNAPAGVAYIGIAGTVASVAYAAGNRSTLVQLGMGRKGLAGGMNTYVNNVSVYDQVLHTSSYTPSNQRTQYGYEESKVDLPNFTYSGLGEIQSLQSFTEVSSGNERYIVDGQYWNGASWGVSDGSYAQANSIADVNTNLSSLVITDDPAIEIPVSVVFPDGDGINQESVDNLSLEYTGQQYFPDGNLKVNSAVMATNLQSLVATLTEPTVGQKVRFVVDVNGQDMYWDGAAWVNSNCTITQANTLSDCNANIPSLLDGLSTKNVFLKVLFETGDQEITPDIDTMTLTFNNDLPVPEECIVTANLESILGSIPTIDLANPPKLHVTASRTFTSGDSVVLAGTQSSSFDAAGETSLSVVVTAPVGEKLEFGISIPDGRSTKWVMFEPAIVPQESTKPLEQITEVRKLDFG